MFAALAHKKDSSVAFIVDSGAFKTQVPESMRHKLRDVTKIRAIPLETAGDVHPTCTEVGFMDFSDEMWKYAVYFADATSRSSFVIVSFSG
jgi:hypothetical protein